MARSLAMLVFVVMTGAVIAAPPPKKESETVESELKKLQGRWKLVEVADGERGVVQDGFARQTLIIKDDQMSDEGEEGKVDEHGPFKLNVDKDPRQIDFNTGEKEGRRRQDRIGIYILEADKLKICFSTVSPVREALRPTDFTPKAKSGNLVMVYERLKD